MRHSIILKYAVCLYVLLAGATTVDGQSTTRDSCLQVMKEMVDHYRATRYLSFDITYRYAAESGPGAYLDSLHGRYRLNGNDYWYSLDSTEVVSYQGTCVLLFKEDHIMYLVPPNGRRKNVDFLVALDSLLLHLGGMEPVLREDGDIRTVLLTFGGRGIYKSIEYSIDRRTGYITRIRQVVKSDQLYDPSVRNRIEGEIPYAVIDMDFSNYRSGAFGDRQLDTAQYFKKEGQQYVSVAPYDEYKIFLGAPNL
ncbi:MAG TPA: hypothetical protein VHD83_24045 [Puia sp.]|nr:hypothetical protein [Puia sp.]